MCHKLSSLLLLLLLLVFNLFECEPDERKSENDLDFVSPVETNGKFEDKDFSHDSTDKNTTPHYVNGKFGIKTCNVRCFLEIIKNFEIFMFLSKAC